jgi:hypothetical protein
MTVSERPKLTTSDMASSTIQTSSKEKTVSSSTTTTSTTPSPTPKFVCEDKDNLWWVAPRVMELGIIHFCSEASQIEEWDEDLGRFGHKRIERKHNKDTDDQIIFIISSATEEGDRKKPDINFDQCLRHMGKIYRDCPPGSYDSRHGGENHVDGLIWNIVFDRARPH